ncbi:MAG: hypothetical protein AAFY08_15590, partial [Planctomycetota bacterium]
SAPAGRLKERIALLDRQSREVRGRARLVRDSLIGMMAMIGCMLACSRARGASRGWRGAVYVAIGLFVLGVLAMGWAVVLATLELSRSLGPVTLEASAVEGELAEGSEALTEPAGV